MNEESRELAPLSISEELMVRTQVIDVSNLIWRTKEGEETQLKFIDDAHLRNIALMLIGMSNQTYNAPDELKVRWLTVLRLEWEKRKREGKTGFKRSNK